VKCQHKVVDKLHLKLLHKVVDKLHLKLLRHKVVHKADPNSSSKNIIIKKPTQMSGFFL